MAASGVQITSHGAVTVTGLNAIRMALYGLYIQNNGGGAANVTLSNVTTNNNVGTGLDILSKGAVTLTGNYLVLQYFRWIRGVGR